MYSYKLNNSYTVYVNYAYLNDCIKASKKKSHPVKTCASPKKQVKMTATPLPDNTLLSHKVFGCGKVVFTDQNGIMSVEFANKTARFVYPDAVKQGFLSLAN